MLWSFLPQRPSHRRGLPLPWLRRWRALMRRRMGRWLVVMAPVALLLSGLAVLMPAAPSEHDLAQAWELAGRIGVVIVTALIGRAMLNHGR